MLQQAASWIDASEGWLQESKRGDEHNHETQNEQSRVLHLLVRLLLEHIELINFLQFKGFFLYLPALFTYVYLTNTD